MPSPSVCSFWIVKEDSDKQNSPQLCRDPPWWWSTKPISGAMDVSIFQGELSICCPLLCNCARSQAMYPSCVEWGTPVETNDVVNVGLGLNQNFPSAVTILDRNKYCNLT
jgi:hypothetical protein